MVAGRSVYAINTSCKELSESKTTRGVRGRTYTSTFECFRSSSAHGHYPHRYMVHYLKVREAMDSVVLCEAARRRQRKNVWTHEGRIQHAKRWLAPRERGQAPASDASRGIGTSNSTLEAKRMTRPISTLHA